MFHRIKRRLSDMGTIRALCHRAEKHALQNQQREPGAEHFLLSALELPDGTARRAFMRVHANPSELRGAIARQYSAALRSIGIDPAFAEQIESGLEPATAGNGLYKAAPSGQEIMRGLAAHRKDKGDTPLLGAHVVAVIAGMAQGIASRSLHAMGVEPEALRTAAEAEIALYEQTRTSHG